MFEDEHEYAQAMEHFGKAADLFGAENSASTAQKAKQNVARLAALMEPPDYEKSSETYAECGMEAMASQLLKFGAKECFQRAVFCTLARNDLVTAQAQFEKFKEQDYTLEGAFFFSAAVLCVCVICVTLAHASLSALSLRPPLAAAPREPRGQAADGPHQGLSGAEWRRLCRRAVQLQSDLCAGQLEGGRAQGGQGAPDGARRRGGRRRRGRRRLAHVGCGVDEMNRGCCNARARAETTEHGSAAYEDLDDVA